MWVFCYGSLIWNPLFHYVERQNVTVHGFHRSFCLRSRHGRGSVEEPGLMLGLDLGGCCNGVALRIPAEPGASRTDCWSGGAKWRSARTRRAGSRRAPDGRKLRSIAFVVNHAHPHYAGKLPLETVTKILATAKGRFGSGADYLYQTVDCLAKHGIHDSYLSRLREHVMKLTHGVHHPVECPEIGA